MEQQATGKSPLLKFVLPLAVLISCVVADQLIKVYIKTNFWPGQMKDLIGHWFKFYFIENNGMAFGIELGGRAGKFLLTGFRLAVSGFGAWYLWQNMRKNGPMGLLISVALIMAGAIGNIIDSIFYGVLFKNRNDYDGGWFEGHVVDMFYAPMIEGHFPKWLPFWGGESFTFFSPIWNFADACITVGVAIIIVGQHKFFPPKKTHAEETTTPENQEPVSEISEIPSENGVS